MTTLQKSVPKKVRKSGSSKSPQYYNNQRRLLIEEIINHEEEDVRMAICSNPRCPSKMLKERLDVEESKDIIKTILMNPSLPQKTVDGFCATDPRGNLFDSENDSDLIEYLQKRQDE